MIKVAHDETNRDGSKSRRNVADEILHFYPEIAAEEIMPVFWFPAGFAE